MSDNDPMSSRFGSANEESQEMLGDDKAQEDYERLLRMMEKQKKREQGS